MGPHPLQAGNVSQCHRVGGGPHPQTGTSRQMVRWVVEGGPLYPGQAPNAKTQPASGVRVGLATAAALGHWGSQAPAAGGVMILQPMCMPAWLAAVAWPAAVASPSAVAWSAAVALPSAVAWPAAVVVSAAVAWPTAGALQAAEAWTADVAGLGPLAWAAAVAEAFDGRGGTWC